MCEVYAATPREVGEALGFLPRVPKVLELRGTRLPDLFADLKALGEATGREGAAEALAQTLRARLEVV
ncbi:hypothetical protein [Thermus tenuipuniceus]|uniref:hypothetical protein n=1 Tax=Thermus tenuipuniceus TaxID=2078690 RepID=UPI001FC8EB9D|nr:hypothetical protein [Thermus tenuipuniceus]